MLSAFKACKIYDFASSMPPITSMTTSIFGLSKISFASCVNRVEGTSTLSLSQCFALILSLPSLDNLLGV